MPEGPELKIMADFINQNTKGKVFDKSFHVLKGNKPEQFHLLNKFKIKQLFKNKNKQKLIKISRYTLSTILRICAIPPTIIKI